MTDDPWAGFKPASPAVDDPWAGFKPAAVPAVAPKPTAPVNPNDMSIAMPEVSPEGFPTGQTIAPQPMFHSPMGYGEQVGSALAAFPAAADRIGANLPFADRFTAAMGAATGVGGKFGDYSGNLAAERERNAVAAAANPEMEGAAKVAASLVTPVPAVGWVARGGDLASKVARGALAGMGIGGIEGASATPDLTKLDEAAVNTATGAGLGGIIGGAVPLAGSAIGGAVRGVANRFAPTVQDMSKRVQNYLTGQITADTPALVQANLARYGPQATLAEGGPALLSTAQGAAALAEHPQAKTAVEQFFENRARGTNARLGQDIEANIGPNVSPQAVSDALQARRQALHTGLPQVFANTPNMDISAVVAKIDQRLAKAAPRSAEATVLNRVKDNLTEEATLPGGKKWTIPTQDSEKIHNAKMDLDMLIKKGDPSLGVPKGMFSKTQGTIGGIRSDINQAIRDQVPGYADINIPSSELARVMEAVQAGKEKILAPGQNIVHPADYARSFPQLPPAEQLGQQVGLRGNIYQGLGTKPNDPLALQHIFQGKPGDPAIGWNQQKLGTAFGQQPIENISQALGREQQFGRTFGKVQEGSQTNPRAQAVAALRGAIAPRADLIPADLRNVTALGGPLELARKGINFLGRAVQRPGVSADMASEVANAITRTGAARDALVDQLMRRARFKEGSAGLGSNVEYLTNLAAALKAHQIARDQLAGQ